MRKTFSTLILSLLVAFTLFSCNKNDNDDPVVAEPPATETPTESPPEPSEPPMLPSPPVSENFPAPGIDGEQVDFPMMQEFVIGPKCLNCHAVASGNQGGINLETYQNIYSRITSIRQQVATGKMPKAPGPALAQVEKNLILKWIDAGATEIKIPIITEPPETGSGVPDREPDPEPVPPPIPDPVPTPTPPPEPVVPPVIPPEPDV